jgi:tetratricopeptide (TPR) repeat protein
VINCFKIAILLLLASPVFGVGQQQPAAKFEALLGAAQKAQAAGDYAAAAASYRQAVRLRSDIPELWANLGLMQHQAGDIAAAILSFQQATHLNPSLFVPNLFLGLDYLRTNKAQQAIPFLLKAEKIDKADPQPALALGRAYISAGDLSLAARELTRATALNPKLSSAWFALGIAHLDQVEKDARKMASEGESSPFAKALFAESLQKQGRYREAATIYREVLLSPQPPPCMRAELGFSLLRQRDPAMAGEEFNAEIVENPGCGLTLLGQAQISIGAGDNEHAVAQLTELWNRDHGFVRSNAAVLFEGLSWERANAFLAFLFSRTGEPRLDLYRTLLAGLNPTMAAPESTATAGDTASPLLAVATGSAEESYRSGHFQRCADSLESGSVAGRADKLSLLAACAFFTGDFQRSSNTAAVLAILEPHSDAALYWSIQAHERLAFEALANFEELEPNSSRSHILLGDIYRQRERFDDAQAEYSKALSLSPHDSGALLGLASAYLSNNSFEMSVATAKRGLAQAPDDPEINLVMAEGLVAQNHLSEAEPYLERSLKAKPQVLAHVHALFGRVYAETGRTEKAIEEFKMGVSSDEDGSLHYLLARLYRQRGDSKAAAEALAQMETIKKQRRDRGVRAIEDSDLSSLEAGMN